jgi:uncharacterized membrane protein
MMLVLLVHTAAALVMVGVIWFVQIVHYPLFGHVGQESFTAYEVAHARLTTWVVAPPMLVEDLTGVLMLWYRPADILALQAWLGIGLIALLWLSTAVIQVPQHNVLAFGFDSTAHQTLVTSNWLRTIAWSLRGLLVLWMLARVMR